MNGRCHTLSRSIGYITECSFCASVFHPFSSETCEKNIQQYRRMRRPPCWLPGRSWEGDPHSCERISSAPLARKTSLGHSHRILIFVVLDQALVMHGSHLVWLGHNLFNLAGGRHPVKAESAEKGRWRIAGLDEPGRGFQACTLSAVGRVCMMGEGLAVIVVG